MSYLTSRQWQLVNAAMARSSDVKQQVDLLLGLARTVGASTADIAAARAHLLRDVVRECSG